MEQHEHLALKPFQETLHCGMCGAGSLLMVLAYYGVSKSEEELASLLHIDGELGTDSAAIRKVAEELGLRVEIKNEGDFQDIERWLERKVPVIVDWFTRGRSDYTESEVADGHYSVVVGLDDENIFLLDPEIGRERRMARGNFRRVWFDFSGECINPEGLILRQLIAIYKK